MALVMSDRSLRLHLRAGESLPCNVSWLIDDGFLRLVSWGDQSEHPLTLGLWGSGALAIW
jgi:hypothetical protein